MKKLISIGIAIIILFQTLTFIVYGDTVEQKSGGYTYIIENQTAKITACDTTVTGDVEIPSVLDGYPVNAIGNDVFSERLDITGVHIPEGIKRIGDFAFFGCSNLINIETPDTLIIVDAQVFDGTGYYNDSNNWTDGTLYLNKILLRVDDFKSTENFQIKTGTISIANSAFSHCKWIKNVTIPNGVKSICDSAFVYCDALTKMVIPNSVTYIGDGSFRECRNLKNISLPQNLTHIGEKAFETCTSLIEINLPDNVNFIGKLAFASCGRIQSIRIPDGVSTLSWGIFRNCGNLKSVFLPKTITSIDWYVFDGCTSLSDIYYDGSEADWINLTQETGSATSGNIIMRSANVHFNDTEDNGNKNKEIFSKPEQISGTFKSNSDTFVGETFFYYDEYDFARSAYTYNHYLSKMSLRLAMSAFAEKSSGYATQYKNAQELLNTLKFQNINWNDSYTEQPTTNSIGVIAGNKKISYEDGDYTLIAVAIRGGGYESEWGGNFNVGNEELHTGFRMARDHVLEFLKNYVSENSITGNIKIWITGYSRAAATTNLTAAYLDSHKYIFGENVNISPENIYAYCFETPAGVKNPPVDEKYNNIFSIVNRNDFVPMVVMDKWNYGRYGVTYYLPSAETNSNYNELLKNMESRYNEYVTSKHNTLRSKTIEQFSEYSLFWEIYPNFSFYLKDTGKKEYKNMGEFLQTVIDELAVAFETPANYSNTAQEALIYIGREIIGKGNTNEFLNVFKEKLLEKLSIGGIANEAFDSLYEIFSDEELSGIIYDSLKDTFKELGVTIENETLDKIVSIFVKLLDKNLLTTLLGNIDIIPVGHYPELCLAWLDVTDETTFTNKDKSFVISQGITVTLNGSPILFDQPPVLQNERTLVPLRAIFEALGATVEWDNFTQTVTSVKDGKTVILTIGSNILYIDGTPITLDVPAQALNGRTLVPVRAVAESFECNVDWNGSTQTVVITN